MAVGPDADLVALDERRGRRLELDLLALDAVGGQLPADAEKASRGLHADLLSLNRRDLRSAAQIDRDFLGFQPAVDANGSAGPAFLGVDSPLHAPRDTDARRRLPGDGGGALGWRTRPRGWLRDHGADRLTEVRRRRLGFRLLQSPRLRIVPGLDLQVRLLVDLAPREPFLKLSEDVLPLHCFHRKLEATAK